MVEILVFVFAILIVVGIVGYFFYTTNPGPSYRDRLEDKEVPEDPFEDVNEN